MAHHPPDDRATHQPRYHGTDEDNAAEAREPLTARQRWTRLLVIVIVIALFLAIVILHVTGTLGGGMHG